MTKSFVYEGKEYQYELVESRGKRLSATIDEYGRMVVRFPKRVPSSAVTRFVEEHRKWLVTQYLRAQEQCKAFLHQFTEGEAFYFLGNSYPLKIRRDGAGKRIRVERLPDCFLVQGTDLTKEMIKKALENWYIHNARIRFESRCAYYAPLIGVTYHTIRIKNQKSRWGSCSGKGNLNFNWKLIMAPEEVLDYLVVHELCHLKYMDHSKEFWLLVASILPNYREQERWIEENQRRILIW